MILAQQAEVYAKCEELGEAGVRARIDANSWQGDWALYGTQWLLELEDKKRAARETKDRQDQERALRAAEAAAGAAKEATASAKRSAFWTAVAAIAALVTAVFGLAQIRETQRQTVNADRAWLGYRQLTDTNLPIVIDRSEVSPKLSVQGHYAIENFGNGPAIKVVQSVFVETDNRLLIVGHTASFTCEANKHFATGTVPVGPGVENPGPMGFVLFPKQVYSDSFSWGGDAQPNLKWLYVIGCVAYLDQFMEKHWTRFVVLIGDCINPIGSASPRKLYTLYNDTDETSTKNPPR